MKSFELYIGRQGKMTLAPVAKKFTPPALIFRAVQGRRVGRNGVENG